MTKVATETIKGAYRNRLMISYILLVGAVLCALWYAFCVFSIMTNSIDIGRGEAKLSEAKREIALLSAEVSKIESGISIATAGEKGFKPSEVSLFIMRSGSDEAGLSKSLSYSNVTRE